jgi:uncharacterized iron-regulated membrane protein
MIFMLLLCLTGLPLIFSHEIDHLTGAEVETPVLPAGTPAASLERITQAAQAHRPGLVPLYLFAGEDDPNLWLVKLDTRVDTDERAAQFATVDARTAQILDAPDFNKGVMAVIYRLHVDMFADLPGKLFLGLMGVLLILSIVSGVVLYAPFMRKLDFGTVRRDRTRRVGWLDTHNLLGITTVVWALVVGGTGVINTWADLILKAWQTEQIAKLRAGETRTLTPAEAVPPQMAGTGIHYAVERAKAAVPDMQIDMIAFPGTLVSTPQHFAVILKGNTPFTSRLRQAVLVDPGSGEVMQASARPWYVTLLQLSQPLHYGDYGGLPLKILWAMLDLLTIVVLGSGLYLWWSRSRQGKEARIEENGLARSRA